MVRDASVLATSACPVRPEFFHYYDTTKYLRNESIILKQQFKTEDWISMTDAARLRGVSRAAIADLVRRRRLKSYEIGGRKLVNKAEILAFQPHPIGRPRKKSIKTKSSKK